MSTVTETEFRANVTLMFKALDMDRNDSLDWKECRGVVTAVMKPDGGYDADSFRAKYDKMDKNADGCISKAELVEAVVAVGRDRNLFMPDGGRVSVRKHDDTDKRMDSAMALDANEVAIDAKVFREGLSCLGKTFNNARHAYLKLNVEGKALTTIKGIERYKYLQYLDLSNNKLVTLTHLGGIKHLIKLNASNN